jgi:hypothetical protein
VAIAQNPSSCRRKGSAASGVTHACSLLKPRCAEQLAPAVCLLAQISARSYACWLRRMLAWCRVPSQLTLAEILPGCVASITEPLPEATSSKLGGHHRAMVTGSNVFPVAKRPMGLQVTTNPEANGCSLWWPLSEVLTSGCCPMDCRCHQASHRSC